MHYLGGGNFSQVNSAFWNIYWEINPSKQARNPPSILPKTHHKIAKVTPIVQVSLFFVPNCVYSVDVVLLLCMARTLSAGEGRGDHGSNRPPLRTFIFSWGLVWDYFRRLWNYYWNRARLFRDCSWKLRFSCEKWSRGGGLRAGKPPSHLPLVIFSLSQL